MGQQQGGVTVYAAPDVIVPARAMVGEGPIWDRRSGRLCWVDIIGGLIVESDLGTGVDVIASLGTLVGAAVPRDAAVGFAVAVADGFGYWVDDRLTIVDPVLPESYRRMNDAACDSRGRLWANSTHVDFVSGMGALHRWDGVGPSAVMADGFTLPNGIGWSPDDTIMYLADSVTHELLHAPYDAHDGDVGQFAPLCTIDSGQPDGLAVDIDGCVWLAIWGGSEVRRYSPAGELVGIVPMPISQPSSCAFGPDGVLYITSARSGLSPAELELQPLAGSVFALASGTSGVPVSAFGA
jgi:sugar lactone lactonase YvrE